MSTLKIFRPDPAHEQKPEPYIVSFRQPWESRKRVQLDEATLRSIYRAKKIKEHRSCPKCQAATVVPVELANAMLNRNRLPIPGTATLVGFRCTQCESEWPVDDEKFDEE